MSLNKENNTGNKWQVKIWSYDHGLLDKFVESLLAICKTSMVQAKSIFLPVKNKRFALLRSAFIYSKSKIHLQIRVHSRSIILDMGTRSMDIFQDLHVFEGIAISLKKIVPKQSINNQKSQIKK